MAEHDSAPIELSEQAIETRRQIQELIDDGKAETWSEAYYLLVGKPHYPKKGGGKPIAEEERKPREDKNYLPAARFIIDHLE